MQCDIFFKMTYFEITFFKLKYTTNSKVSELLLYIFRIYLFQVIFVLLESMKIVELHLQP